MKSASAGLIALLNASGGGQSLIQSDLYTITLIDGTVLHYSGADLPITIGGTTWALGPTFKRGKTSTKLGTEVSKLTVTIAPNSGDTIEGTAWLAAAASGALDGAAFLLERFISDAWTNTSVGKIYQYLGLVGGVTIDRSIIVVDLNSPAILLNVSYPKKLFQATCQNTLYDARCGLSKAAFTVTGAITGASTTAACVTNLTQADGYFNLGVIKFTSGANAGLQRTVDSFTHGFGVVVIVFSYPLPYAPALTDTFSIYPGCNKMHDAAQVTGPGIMQAYIGTSLFHVSSAGTLYTSLSAANGTYNGWTVFTRSANITGSKSVITTSYLANGELILTTPFSAAPYLGTPLTLVPPSLGASTSADCSVKFTNTANFRGMPFIPIAETAY